MLRSAAKWVYLSTNIWIQRTNVGLTALGYLILVYNIKNRPSGGVRRLIKLNRQTKLIIILQHINMLKEADLVLATQSIEAWAQQEGRMQACTIGLSISEDPKLEKGKEKNSSATRSYIRSSSHVSSRDSTSTITSTTIHRFPPAP